MLDHVTFGVSDFARSCAFYDRALHPLGVSRLFEMSDGGVPVAGYGDDRPWFWIAAQDATHGKLHIALTASDRHAVDSFYHAAIAAGGRDNGALGPRPHYHAHYYAALVLDPDGHNIEAVFGNERR